MVVKVLMFEGQIGSWPKHTTHSQLVLSKMCKQIANAVYNADMFTGHKEQQTKSGSAAFSCFFPADVENPALQLRWFFQTNLEDFMDSPKHDKITRFWTHEFRSPQKTCCRCWLSSVQPLMASSNLAQPLELGNWKLMTFFWLLNPGIFFWLDWFLNLELLSWLGFCGT